MNILQTYLRDISRYQPITQEQELTLALRARQGDTAVIIQSKTIESYNAMKH